MKINWTTAVSRGLMACVLAAGFAAWDRDAQAQSTFVPTSGSGINWGTAGNWSPSGVPSATGAAVIFNSPTATLSVSLNGTRTVGSISITNDTANTFTLANGTGGSLTLDATGSGPATIVVGGTGNVVNTISASTTLTDNLTVTVNNTTTGSASGALTLTGTIGGTGTGITKEGAGTLSLTTAAKTYTGATTVNGGILRVSEVAQPSSSSSLAVASGAQLRLDSNGNRTWTVSAGSVTLNGTGGSANGALRFQGTLTTSESQAFTNAVVLASDSSIHLEDADGFIDFTGGISGAGGLVKRGSGTLRLSSSATYGGSTSIINGGIRLNGAANRLPTATTLALGDSGSSNLGTLDMNGLNQELAGLNSTTGTNVGASNNTITSVGAATLTLGGAGTYSYGDGTDANSGVIAGAISLVKSGSGTQTLGDVNTYSGATSITGGTLVIASTGSINSSSGVTINGGELKYNGSTSLTAPITFTAGTITGTGTIASALTVGAGATLSPGNSPGIQGFGGNQVWANGGNYNWQILDAAGSAGTGFDQVQITGTLDVASGFNLNLWSLSSIGPDVNGNALNFNNTLNQSWTIATTTGGILNGGNLATANIFVGANNGTGGFSNSLGGGSFSVAAVGNNVVLSFTAVPEPGSLALLACGGVAFLAWNRKRRTSK